MGPLCLELGHLILQEVYRFLPVADFLKQLERLLSKYCQLLLQSFNFLSLPHRAVHVAHGLTTDLIHFLSDFLDVVPVGDQELRLIVFD